MSYHTYITEALVCGSCAVRTSDRSYLLFTREAGMLYAIAQSVREERSKQRCALQEFSHVRVSLVHGKSGWRIAGTEALGSLYAHEGTREARALVRNVFLLLRRVIRGEEAHPKLFDDVLMFLCPPDTVAYKDAYLVGAFRILHALGYVAIDAANASLITEPSLDIACAVLTDEIRTACQRSIDYALRESHL